MNFGKLMSAIKISFFGMWVPSKLPKKEILFQNGFWITYAAIKFSFLVILMAYIINNFLKRQFCFPRAKKISSFLVCLHNPSKFPFLESPYKEIFFPKRQFHSSKGHMICLHKPSKFPFGILIVGTTFYIRQFPKRQFCFYRSTRNLSFFGIFSYFGNFIAKHYLCNPSKFPFFVIHMPSLYTPSFSQKGNSRHISMSLI